MDVFLYAHDDSFGISIDGKELMHSKASASECYLGKIGVSHLINAEKSRILIGGLGLGFTLKSVLSHSSSFVKVDIVEIIPEIIDWNKTFLHGLNGSLLEDARVNVVNADVSEIICDTQSNFYDGIIFHRVIEGFMAQTGDPTGTGMGGSDLPDIRAEFSDEPFVRGTLGMARSQHPDSANSQFFICFEEASFLNGQYTVFGKVVEGMEYIDKVMRGEPPDYPDKIVSMKLSD